MIRDYRTTLAMKQKNYPSFLLRVIGNIVRTEPPSISEIPELSNVTEVPKK